MAPEGSEKQRDWKMRSENDQPICHRSRPWRPFQKVACYAAVTDLS